MNCGGSHPASYRGCIVAKELQSIKNQKLSKSKPQQQTKHSQVLDEAQDQVNNRQRVVDFASQQGQHRSEAVGEVPKMTYANVTRNNVLNQTNSQSYSGDLNQSINLILTKMIQMESSVAAINEKVKFLEGRIQTSASNFQR